MTPPVGPRAVRKFPFRFTLISLVLSVTLAGCTRDTRDLPEAEPPQKIVSLVPAVTEILFAIGAGDRVVGISDFDTYPPEALNRPRVGALIDPNVETILALQPDLVIAYGTQSLLRERLAVGGIRQFPFVTGQTIGHILDSIRGLGRELGLQENGDRLAQEIQGTLDRLRNTRPANPPTVLLAHYRDLGTMGSFYSAGADSYYGELIEIAGGQNIFADVPENAFQPTLEAILDRAPEVIIELLPSNLDGDQQRERRLEDWAALSSVPAVRNGRVYVLAGDYLLLVGPRLRQVALDFADVIRTGQVSSSYTRE